MIADAEANQCVDAHGAPIMTLLDFRNGMFLQPEKPFTKISTACRTIRFQLDDLLKPDVRARIPKEGLLVTITETGNRDIFVKRYLSQYGYGNICGLRFGMRGWIKKGYPTQ